VPTDDTWASGGYSPIGPDVSQPAGEPSGGPSPIGSWDNPADPLEESLDEDGPGVITGGTGTGGIPITGDTLSVSEADLGCDGQVCWSKINKDTGEETDISCQDEAISGAYTLSITTSEIDHFIVAVGRCKDPSTASGYGEPRTLGTTAAVEAPPPPPAQYAWFYVDDLSNSSVFNSTVEPTFSAPYACGSFSGGVFCNYNVTLTACDGTTSTSPSIAYGPSGTPSFTYTSKTFVANCP